MLDAVKPLNYPLTVASQHLIYLKVAWIKTGSHWLSLTTAIIHLLRTPQLSIAALKRVLSPRGVSSPLPGTIRLLLLITISSNLTSSLMPIKSKPRSNSREECIITPENKLISQGKDHTQHITVLSRSHQSRQLRELKRWRHKLISATRDKTFHKIESHLIDATKKKRKSKNQ